MLVKSGKSENANSWDTIGTGHRNLEILYFSSTMQLLDQRT